MPVRLTGMDSGDRRTRAILYLGIGSTACVAWLGLSGVILAFTYRPESDAAALDPSWWTTLLRLSHRGVGVALVLAVVVMAMLSLAHPLRRLMTLSSFAAAAAVVAASLTGYLLPWDQLALTQATVGTDYDGVLKAAFSEEVRFLLIDGVEVSQGTYARWVLVHLVGLPPLVFGAAFGSSAESGPPSNNSARAQTPAPDFPVASAVDVRRLAQSSRLMGRSSASLNSSSSALESPSLSVRSTSGSGSGITAFQTRSEISTMISGFSCKNFLAFSRPWPSCSPS